MNTATPFTDKTITVSEVNATIKACFDSPIFQYLEVFGEVSGFKTSGAHAYFTLKDENSQISCVCFNYSRTYKPKDGESVILRGKIDYYVKGGRLSLQATSITPVGQGLLFLQFERLRAKLTEEGLFDDKYKVPIPQYVSNVLVVTSKTGAVIRDINTTIRKKNPVINIIVRDVRVQGEGAAHEISGVLARVDKLGYDVIIIARGGGSLEDLAPFYDEELVRAVFAMKTPVISAVGHETDFSLVDFVADKRAATPTAAAEMVAYDYYALVDSLKVTDDRLVRLVKHNFERKSARARVACTTVSHKAQTFYTERGNKVRRLIENLSVLATRNVQKAENRAQYAVGMLDSLSPLKILSRGYFYVQAAGKSVTSVRKLKVGETITAQGGDGTVKAEIKEILIKDNNPTDKN